MRAHKASTNSWTVILQTSWKLRSRKVLESQTFGVTGKAQQQHTSSTSSWEPNCCEASGHFNPRNLQPSRSWRRRSRRSCPSRSRPWTPQRPQQWPETQTHTKSLKIRREHNESPKIQTKSSGSGGTERHLVVARVGGGDDGARAAPGAAGEGARVARREAELGEELVLLPREARHGGRAAGGLLPGLILEGGFRLLHRTNVLSEGIAEGGKRGLDEEWWWGGDL